jgi:hypothetical protein
MESIYEKDNKFLYSRKEFRWLCKV